MEPFTQLLWCANERLSKAAARLREVGLAGLSGQTDPPLAAAQAFNAVEHLRSQIIGLLVIQARHGGIGNDPDVTDTSILQALQRLLAVSVRRPATISADGFISEEDLAYSVITRHAVELSCALISLTHDWNSCANDTRSLAGINFALTLMRMHTLHCYSRQLAAITAIASEEVWPAAWTSSAPSHGEGFAAGTGVDPEHAQRAARLGEPVREHVITFLFGGVHLLRVLSGIGRYVSDGYRPPLGAGCGETAPGTEQIDVPRRRSMVCELAAALRDSCFVEHLAKAWLTTQCKPSELRALPQQLDASWVSNLLLGFISLQQISCYCREEGMEAEAAALQGVLSGSCVQCLVLAMGVATLHSADDGPVYGMSQELLRCLPAPDHAHVWYKEADMCYIFDNVFNGVIQMLIVALNSTTAGARSLPLGRRSALALLLRIGRCAMASMLTWTRLRDAEVHQVSPCPPLTAIAGGGSGDAAIQPPPGPPGCKLAASPYVATVACVEALNLAVKWPGAAMTVLAEEEYWRLVAGTARELQVAGLTREHLRMFAQLLQPPPGFDPGMQRCSPLPPSPPPWTAMALSGGLLPCLERLLRRAGEAPRGPEAAVVSALFRGTWPLSWSYLWSLLAYGETRQAAALMSTLGKVLRRLTPQLLVECSASSPKRNSPAADAEALGINDLEVSLSCTLSNVLSHGILWMSNTSSAGQSHEGDSRDSPAAAAAQQLGSVLMHAAYNWLPTLSKVLNVRLRNLEQHHRWPADGVDIAVLTWLARLTFSLCKEPVAEAVASGTPADVAAAVSDLTRMLLLEVRLMTQLEDALGAARELHGSGCWDAWHLARIVECSSSVAEYFPDVQLAFQITVVQSAIDREAAGAEGSSGAAGSSAGGNVSGSGRPAGGGRGSQPRRGGRGSGGSSTAAAGSGPVADGSGAPAAVGSSAAGAGAAGRGEANLHGWRPHNFRYLQEVLQREEDCTVAASCAGEMAELLEQWAAGVTDLAARNCNRDGFFFDMSLLVSARGLLRTCTHRGCTNLAGDSEAELRLRACDGCGAAWYCCRECQLAHWRNGHREQCGGRQRRGG